MKALPSLSSTTSLPSPTRLGIGSNHPNPLVSSTTPPAAEEPSPTDLLLATPPTLLKLFALCAPAIHVSATFVQLVTWTHPSFFASLLVLLSWWGVCLFGRVVALYGLNAAVLLLLTRKYITSTRRGAAGTNLPPPSSIRHRPRPATLSPAAYAQLINSANILASHVSSLRTSVIHPISLHFSFVPLRPLTRAPAYDTAWLLLTSYPFYLLLTYLVPLRYLFLLSGSVLILWQAPFFTTLRTLLWRSALVRWLARLGLGVLSGGRGLRTEWGRTKSGLGVAGLIGTARGATGAARRKREEEEARRKVEEKAVKKRRSSSSSGGAVARVAGIAAPLPSGEVVMAAATNTAEPEEIFDEEDAATDEDGEDVQVQFTVFENQRWWVGLDWTHALLPGERASWTDPANNPANPPASFVLPPPSVAYIPSPTKSDPHSRLKKTTEWKWLDPEWHVLRSAIPSVSLPTSVVPPGGVAGGPPSPLPESDSASSAAVPPPAPQAPASPTISRIAAAAGVALPPSLLPSSSSSSSPDSSAPTLNPSYLTPSPLPSPTTWTDDSRLFANWTVDDEGWQYADNKFENPGARNGLGKYTRRRAWVRRAGLVERTERVGGVGAEAGGAEGVGKKEALGGVSTTMEERKGRKGSHGAEAVDLVKRSSSKSDSLRKRLSKVAGGGGGGEGTAG